MALEKCCESYPLSGKRKDSKHPIGEPYLYPDEINKLIDIELFGKTKVLYNKAMDYLERSHPKIYHTLREIGFNHSLRSQTTTFI